jgi:transposase
VKFKQALAKKVPVVVVDEYRTTKLCRECGSVLEHPKFTCYKGALSRCLSQSCPSYKQLKNRDQDAAAKIGVRFARQLRGLSLGSWDTNAPAEELARNMSCNDTTFSLKQSRVDIVPALST